MSVGACVTFRACLHIQKTDREAVHQLPLPQARERDAVPRMLGRMRLRNVMDVAEPSTVKWPGQGFEVQCKLEVERSSGVKTITCRIIVVRRTQTRWSIGLVDFGK